MTIDFSVSTKPFNPLVLARGKQSSLRLAIAIVGSLFIGVCIGCQRGDGIPRALVSGKAEYDGSPIEEGRVRFIPIDGSAVPLTIAFVKNGTYTTAESDGVPVGKHRVEIVAYDAADFANRQSGFGEPPPRQLLPAKYNRKSEIVFEVAADGDPTIHDFLLER